MKTGILFGTLLILASVMFFGCSDEMSATAPEAGSDEVLVEPVKKYTSGDVIFDAFQDSRGDLWFCTSNEGVFKYDGESFTQYTTENGLCSNDISQVVEDAQGQLWFATDKGICGFDESFSVLIPLPQQEINTKWLRDCYPVVNPNGVSSLFVDSAGVFWIGSNGAGAYRYDGKSFESYLTQQCALMPDSLHHNVVSDIIQDHEGNIWFTSFSHGGVSRYDGSSFTHYDTTDGLGDDMIASAYVQRDGRVWFGTRGGGMSYVDGEGFQTVYRPEGECHNNMATLFEDSKGRLWMASYTRSGVCWYEDGEFTSLEIKNSDKLVDIKCIGEDRNGNIWFGGRYGILWRYDGLELKDFTQKF